MPHLYKYCSMYMVYSEFKLHRALMIGEFLRVRHYHRYPRHSHGFKLYAQCVLKFIKFLNPDWGKTPFVIGHNLFEFDN